MPTSIARAARAAAAGLGRSAATASATESDEAAWPDGKLKRSGGCTSAAKPSGIRGRARVIVRLGSCTTACEATSANAARTPRVPQRRYGAERQHQRHADGDHRIAQVCDEVHHAIEPRVPAQHQCVESAFIVCVQADDPGRHGRFSGDRISGHEDHPPVSRADGAVVTVWMR
ncbi:MAG TPA: hypothetical protein VGX50_02105, partial [Longimicrobium sp.]|nr:hypothetical protein [Longimicrobium sp.]